MEKQTNGVTVDFILSEPEAKTTRTVDILKMPKHTLRCGCGSDQFVLANVLKADNTKGIPASSMYECINCGEYRLG